MGRLSTVLPSLQQLRQLQLKDSSFCEHEVTCDAVLSGLGALTNLTHLVLPEVADGELLQHLPASLLQLELVVDEDEGPVQLGHLTALTRLDAGQYATLREHHVLPPNLLELSAGNLTAAACLLPLKKLKELTLHTIEYEAASAEQLQQLSSLTALTAVHLTYWTPADITDTAAAGWPALKLRSLHLAPGGDGCFARSTLLQLSLLTDPTAMRQRAMPRLTHLSLEKQRVGRAAAASLSQVRGLRRLQLMDCQLEDCSAAEIALGLKPRLKELDLASNAQLTDACLPPLAYALPGLKESSFRDCAGISREGLRQYVLRAAGDDEDGSYSDSE
uniref:Uncharacterized protein n=1 Tax=Tetradesmus obliquus TaxID=3088 RepID=A0A383VCM0_TETOB|eukprot:jgi/Sobl393_1/8593/SZX63315.1